MTKDTKGVRQVLEAVIVVGFLYGIQSDLLPKEEVEHRIAGFKNTKAYKEAEAALQEIMLGMLPEEKYVNPKNTEPDFYAKDEGFNECRKLIEQNIRGGFNNG